MRFIHSNKQYIERTMYPINPYMNAPAVPTLAMEAFVAPANFNPDAQELNIVKAFAAYPDANKKYIFSVGTSTTTVLPAVGGRSYAYAENGGAYTTITSGTITWTVGSTKRNVIVIDSTSSVVAEIPNGGVWCYVSEKVYSCYSTFNPYLKYIHCQIVNSISLISGSAFVGCTGLSTINIPSSVTSIAIGAFQGCTGLSTINIPSSVTSIGDNVFLDCINASFNSDNLVLSLISLGTNAFRNCQKLKHIDLSNSSFTVIDSPVFYNCINLLSVILPNSLTKIQNFTFSLCTSLNNITIPNSVTSIQSSAFQGCTGLLTITIPNSVTSIGESVFWNCINASFNSDNLVLSLISLGTNAFRNCQKLKHIDLSNSSFTVIDSPVFYNCINLLSVILPNSLTKIQNSAFESCTGLNIIFEYAITPPILSSNGFSGVNKSIPLHIPIGSLSAYQAAPYWNEFTNIIADL